MANERDGGKYHEIIVPPLVQSRSTGEQIPLAETVPFDRMPLLLGSQFLADDGLRAGVHFSGRHHGPYLAIEEAYTNLAGEALDRGWVYAALDHYKRALHHGMQWSKGFATWQHGGAFTMQEVLRFDPSPRFAELEDRLATAVWQSTSTSVTAALDTESYTAFVRQVRQREKRAIQLNELFFHGESQWFEPITAAGIHDPEIGREYIDLSVAMGRFSTAAWIAGILGLNAEVADCEERAKQEPRDNPRANYLIEDWERRREFGG